MPGARRAAYPGLVAATRDASGGRLGGAAPRAVEMMERAYAPYSHFPVGVAGLVDDGRVVAGCNVENAAYGVGLCAECGMVSELHATGGGRLVAVYVRGRATASRSWRAAGAASCSGRTAGPTCLVMTPEGVLPMSAGAAAGVRRRRTWARGLRRLSASPVPLTPCVARRAW